MAQELVRVIEAGGARAARALIALTVSDDPRRKEIRALVQARPEVALAVIQNPDSGLTPKGAADVLEEVVGLVSEEAAATLLADHLTTDRRRELIGARGDLGSATALIESLNVIIGAIAADIEPMLSRTQSRDDEGGESEDESVGLPAIALLTVRSWCMKLTDREDYEELLDHELAGHTIRELLVLSAWVEAYRAEGKRDVTPDLFNDVNIDPDEGQRILRELLAREHLSFDTDEVEEARIAAAERRREREQAPTLTEEATAEAEEEAEDLF